MNFEGLSECNDIKEQHAWILAQNNNWPGLLGSTPYSTSLHVTLLYPWVPGVRHEHIDLSVFDPSSSALTARQKVAGSKTHVNKHNAIEMIRLPSSSPLTLGCDCATIIYVHYDSANHLDDRTIEDREMLWCLSLRTQNDVCHLVGRKARALTSDGFSKTTSSRVQC